LEKNFMMNTLISLKEGGGMSSHLRHCPKHRKPLPCAHCALVAKPASPVVAVIEPLPILKRRGRPSKFGSAMTPAERKATSRANQKAREDDVERKKLVAELMKIYNRQQSDLVVDDEDSKATEERRRVIREQERRYHDDLMQLSLTHLRATLYVQQETPDSHGRLHNERSGAPSRSEIEHLHFKAETTGAFTTGDDPGNAGLDDVDPLLAGTSRVRPGGAGSGETDPDDDDGDVRPSSGRQTYEPTGAEKRLQKVIEHIIDQMIVEDETVGAQCPFCDQFFLVEQGAENHLYEQYGAGKRERERFERHRDMVFEFQSSQPMPPGYIPLTSPEPTSVAYQHYVGINLELADMKKPRKPEG
jgi:hypothetical protein